MTDFSEIITTAQQAAGALPVEPGKVFAVLDGDTIQFADTDRWAEAPRHVVRNPRVTHPEGFVAYLEQREAHDDAYGVEVWADVERLSVHGILDGNRGWREDRVTLELRPSPEWEAWTARSGKLYDQLTFADFIEDQLSVIADPDGSTLLEIVQSIQGSTKATWQSADWLDNGARSFGWAEEVEGKAGRKGNLVIPSRFTVGLRPFVGSEPFRVVANLRYRIERGGLAIGFKLPELDRIVEQAFNEVVAVISDGVACPVLPGRPN